MSNSVREIKESPWEQGRAESRAYSLTVTPWGSSPSSVSVKLYQLPALTDVTAAYLSGSASVTGDVITTPTVASLVAGVTYRMEIKFTVAGRVEEAYGFITATR
jgi:hypothetical protein